jgi:hypothetical protein
VRLSVAFVIQHAKRTSRIIVTGGPSAVPYFSTLTHKKQSFFLGGGIIEYKMCVLIFFSRFA